jgi:hypothetical protein
MFVYLLLNFIYYYYYYYYYSRVDNDYFVTSPKRTNYYKKLAIKFVMFPVLEVGHQIFVIIYLAQIWIWLCKFKVYLLSLFF